MKWFTHDCDMHADLKTKELIEREGMEGYAIYILCLELLGKFGVKGKLETKKRWKKGLLKIAEWSDEGKLDRILNVLGELQLICPKSLSYGNLYCKTFMKRADNWTRKQLRSNYGAGTEQVPLYYNTLQDITRHYITLKGWMEVAEKNKELMSDLFKRNVKSAKKLFHLSGSKESAIEAMDWMDKAFKKKGLSWTIETVIKWLPEYIKTGKKPDKIKKLEAMI